MLYEIGDGRISEGARRIVQQGSGQVGGHQGDSDHFGAAFESVDLDYDGYTDAVVASSREDIGPALAAGMVQIIWAQRQEAQLKNLYQGQVQLFPVTHERGSRPTR